MIKIRRSEERGHADHGWLNAYHTFSFADYYDPNFMGFRSLRVINEDRVAPGRGFGTHGHRDMEIITYVLEGSLAHKDSMGNEGAIKRDEVQYMSAGRGVQHSEFNHSESEPVHLLQIWIEPDRRGYAPQYDQRVVSAADKRGKLRLVASNEGGEGIQIRQDAKLYASILGKGEAVEHGFDGGRAGWLQVVRGSVEVDGNVLVAGDGAAITDEAKVLLKGAEESSEFLLFDLA